jgi:hypothetical protein
MGAAYRRRAAGSEPAALRKVHQPGGQVDATISPASANNKPRRSPTRHERNTQLAASIIAKRKTGDTQLTLAELDLVGDVMEGWSRGENDVRKSGWLPSHTRRQKVKKHFAALRPLAETLLNRAEATCLTLHRDIAHLIAHFELTEAGRRVLESKDISGSLGEVDTWLAHILLGVTLNRPDARRLNQTAADRLICLKKMIGRALDKVELPAWINRKADVSD